jgi:hypothetical protein
MSIIGDVVGDVLKVVTPAIDSIVGVMGKQQGIMEDMVQAPVQAIIGEVTNGVWTGAGADAFIEECNSIFLPNAASVIDEIGAGMGSITAAVDTIQQADQKAASLVTDGLTELFDGIFKI